MNMAVTSLSLLAIVCAVFQTIPLSAVSVAYDPVVD